MTENICGATAKSTGEPCQRPSGWGTDSDSGRCKYHGGNTPQKDENPDVGDGDQEGNQNAMTTGVNSDPVNLFNWCAENEPEALSYILTKLWDYSKHSSREVFVADFNADDVECFEDVEVQTTGHGDDLLLMCIRDYSRWRGSKKQIVEGLTTEQVRQGEHGTYTVTDANPVNLQLDRMDKTTIQQKDKLGVLPDDGADVEVSVTAELWDDLTEYYE